MKIPYEHNRMDQPSAATCPECGDTLRQRLHGATSKVMRVWCTHGHYSRNIDQELKTAQQQHRDQDAHYLIRKQPNFPASAKLDIRYDKPPTTPLREGEE